MTNGITCTEAQTPTTYWGLQRYFLSCTVERVTSEVSLLEADPSVQSVHDAGQLSWGSVTDFSLSSLRDRVLALAPITWTLLTTIAAGGGKHVTYRETYNKNKKTGRGSNQTRDPWLVSISGTRHRSSPQLTLQSCQQGCTVALCILLYFHHLYANAFQSVIGILLFATNTQRNVHTILSRLGLSTAYSTTLRHLHALGDAASNKLKDIGRQFVARKATFHIVYDNLNQYHKNWRPSLGKGTSLESGTAATLIIQQGVDAAAFDGIEYERRKREVKKRDISHEKMWKDVDHDHLQRACIVQILRILVCHVPGIKRRFSGNIQALCEKTLAKRQLPVSKTEYYPCETSGYDEATVKGNRDTLRDLLFRQLGVTPDEVEGRLVPVSGDQMTIARLRTLREQTSSANTWHMGNRWILPLIEIWHMGLAMIKGIFKIHWCENTVKGDFGLRHANDLLRRKLNINKLEFYPAERLTDTVLATMTLNYFRAILQQEVDLSAEPQKRLHLTEELDSYTGDGQILSKCPFEYLYALAEKTYVAFGSTKSAYMALHPNSERAGGNTGADGLEEDEEFIEDMLAECEGSSRASILLACDDETQNDAPVLEAPPEASSGDILMFNNIMLWQDLLHYSEFRDSVKEGDVGRTFEVIKWLRFWFFGVGATNYGHELLHQMLDLWFHFSPATLNAVLDNYFVNTSGERRRFHARDLLQEHINCWLKRVFNNRLATFGSSFMRQTIALNILHLTKLTRTLSNSLGLADPYSLHSSANITADINVLGYHYATHSHHIYIAGRTQSYLTVDGISRGSEKLRNGVLKNFVDEHIELPYRT
ncbi:uncharacterized protein EI90DRAFT_2956624 [Cantharellus anzutake]|uniref:uncharacterized protein n=1 Tax=Cantharellus anzutake TaxID=1750568 RepID=UPI001906FE19|nr:uncharacterized protein EI90DRAFT_2956624 [Cantharellus anzutake]KAF8310443.1 hypothetical protein EI90DRAFT_2956624 [Cantharellus anzutake]